MKKMTDEQKLALIAGKHAAKQKRLEAEASGAVVERLTPSERAAADPRSLRKAIDAKCWECEGGDADPHVGWRIGNCACEKTCGLYAVRPYQKHKGTPPPKSLQDSYGIFISGDNKK